MMQLFITKSDFNNYKIVFLNLLKMKSLLFL